MKTYTFQIAETARDLKVLFANVAAKTALRFYLRGIFVDPEGVLVATDGHAMAELDYPATDETREAIAAYCAATGHQNLIIEPWKVSARGGSYWLQIDVPEATDTSSRVFVSVSDLSGKQSTQLLDTSLSEGKFPDWRRATAWSEYWTAAAIGVDEKFTLGVNPALLARFQTNKDTPLRLVFSGSNAAIKVQSLDSEIRGTVMPARV
jgi:hypothetical protein